MRTSAVGQIKHPYISINTKISMGSPVITGTRIRVKAISARDIGNQNMSLAFHFGMCNSLANIPMQESGVFCGLINYD